MLDDLTEFIGSDTTVSTDDLSPYFLGSIVLIKGEGDPNAEVVDGQQRLTTLNILMAALRHTIQEKTFATAMTKYLYEEGDPIEGNPNRYRLTLRERDAEFFRKHVQDAGQIVKLKELDTAQLTDSRRNIHANAVLYLNRLDKLSDDRRIRLAQFIVKNCLLVVVSTPDLDSAYRIFSILNDRGLDLSHSDILKSEIIGRITETQQDEYNENWEDAEEELGRDAFSDLFAHTRMIHRKQKGRESVLKEFREYVVKPVGDSKKLIDDVLIPYADAFSIIQTASYESTEGAERINQMLKWLNRIDNTDWVPPAILFLARNKANPIALDEFLGDLERLAAFLMICRYGINERMERYGKLLTAIEKDDDLCADESPLQLSSDECRQFEKELNGDVYRQVPKRRLYILLRLDSELSDGSATYDHGVISIEHVLPQKPKADSTWCEWFPTRECRDSWVHRLGNLLLLNHRKNSSASNYEFDKKKKVYFSKGGVSPFPLTTQAIGETEWTEEVVKRRQDELAELLKSAWRIDVAPDDETIDAGEEDIDENEPLDEGDDSNAGTEKSGRDYTKFDVTVGGTTYEAQSKRVAVFRVVAHLCSQGVTPEEIAEVVPWRTNMFCSTDGVLSSDEFVAKMKSKVESGGKRRFFCNDSELIHSDERTYAVTSGWGTKAFHAIQNMLKQFPDKGVTCVKHEK